MVYDIDKTSSGLTISKNGLIQRAHTNLSGVSITSNGLDRVFIDGENLKETFLLSEIGDINGDPAPGTLDELIDLLQDMLLQTPTVVTKESIGLGNVNNTSDANKPVSTAQAAAIAGLIKINTFVGDGVTTVFTTSAVITTPVVMSVAGAVGFPTTDYTAAGTALTILSAPALGENVLFVFL